jgi:thiamine transport system ATP-binding protein
LTGVRDGLACTVTARTFRGDLVTLLLRPADGPPLEAACPLRDAPETGARVGVAFTAQDVVVLTA